MKKTGTGTKKSIALAAIAVAAMLCMLLPAAFCRVSEVSASDKSKTVTSVSVRSGPAKLRYTVGDRLNVKGLKLTLRYKGGGKATDSGGFTCSPTKLSKAGKQKLTLRYKGYTASLNVKVSKATTAGNKPKNTDFVLVRDYIPDIEVELMYATDRNFTGKVIYDFNDAWLRYGTVKKLSKAQEKLKDKGFRIKIWDAFRPVSAQFRLWEVSPTPGFVANPNKGYSSHSRGNTLDITLVATDGSEVKMPTGFDEFTSLADRDYSDVKDKTAVSNAKLLEKTMSECGFKPYSGEWWHFSDKEKYSVAKNFAPE